MEIIKKLYALLTVKDKRLVLILLCQMCVSSLVNIFGMALIFPFMALMAEPDLLFKQKSFFWASIRNISHCNDVHRILIVLGAMTIFFLVLGNVFLMITLWSSTRFAMFRNHEFSKRLLEKYLSQPYSFFLSVNSLVLVKNIVVEVYSVIQNILLSFIRMLDQIILTTAILIMLFIVKPLLSVFIFVGFGGVYCCIYFITKNGLLVISKKSLDARNAMFKITNEAFNGIKNVKFLGIELNVVDRFSKNSLEFSDCATTAGIIGQFPRYVLEIIAFGSIIGVVFYFLLINREISSIVPLLSLYVFAGYRLMPSLQQIFSYAAQIKLNKCSLDVIHKDIVYLPIVSNAKEVTGELLFDKELCLKNISYSYPGSNKSVICRLNLSIKPNTTVGLVGSTGAGKTTVIDIILGLLKPNSGHILIDGKEINKDNLRLWQNSIGYVAQHTYLSDDTIINNIAFGVLPGKVNAESVEKAIDLANLRDFIGELPAGGETMVGERGVRLSGGQAQRIGIARALYRDPKILVLDEATSSLDNVTEDEILQAINNVAHKKTIIMIAHRLSTIAECDTIFFMKNGKVVESGTYKYLLDTSAEFRKMARQK